VFQILFPDARFQGLPTIEAASLDQPNDFRLHVFHERSDGLVNRLPAKILAECDAMVVYHKVQVDRALLATARNCRLVVRAGVGFNNIDLMECGRRGIPVCNVPDYGISEIADHTVALMLTLVRGVVAHDNRLRKDLRSGWSYEGISSIRRIRGSVIGLIGFGRIGIAVAERILGFGVNIVWCDPYISSSANLPDVIRSNQNVRRVENLRDLLAISDIVSLHLPLTSESNSLINAATMANMKNDAILINTSRGSIVDTKALLDALRNQKLAAAALDVLPHEPADLSDPLVAAWIADEPWLQHRLLITPHAAFFSPEGYRELREKSMQTVIAFLRHGQLKNCVNQKELSVGYRSNSQ
jgi:lactate dehydrogenase-like 2-hydroxyacid dehydrogenase